MCDKNRTSTEIGGGEVDCVTRNVKMIRFSYSNKDTKDGEKDEGGQARDEYIQHAVRGAHAYVSHPHLAARHNRLRREGHKVG